MGSDQLARPVGAGLTLLAIAAMFAAHLAPLVGPVATLGAYVACFGLYVFVLWAVRQEVPGPALIAAIVVCAFGVRIVLAFAEPTLSDDIFRYVWEGRVTVAGYNPFEHAPAAEVLNNLRDAEIWPRINHPEVPTIYPPIAQLVFAGVALAGGGTTMLRLVFVAFEAAAVLAAWHLTSPEDESDRDETVRVIALALYSLNPLVMLEVGWSGHLDVLAWSGLALSLVLLAKRGFGAMVVAGILLGASIGTKLLALLLVPYLLLRRPTTSWREAIKRRFVLLGTAFAIVGSSYVVFLDAGPKLFGGFGTYAASWRANDGVFRAWEHLSYQTLQQGEETERKFEFPRWNDFALEHGITKQWQGKTLPATTFATNQISQTIAKFAAALAVGIALLFCIFVVRDPIVGSLIILGTLYIVAPTVHPWYVAWLVPLAALRWNFTSFVFSGTVLVAYIAWASVELGGPWAIPWWLVAAEYGFVLAVLGWEVGRRKET